MKIIVSIKQVPARDSALHVASDGKWLDEENLSYEMNEPDAYALEEALQLKEKLSGEVVVLTLGPERAGSTIREALAKGADRAIHVQTKNSDSFDALATAKLLAEAIRSYSPDLVLTGLQSDDAGYGQTGVILAELLGYAHATIVMEVEPEGDHLRVKRELEDGWFQNVTLPLPAVLTIQSGIKRLRYATLMGIKKAKSKTIDEVGAGQIAANGATIDKLYVPQRSKTSEIFTGNGQDVAKKLAERLKAEVRL